MPLVIFINMLYNSKHSLLVVFKVVWARVWAQWRCRTPHARDLSLSTYK